MTPVESHFPFMARGLRLAAAAALGCAVASFGQTSLVADSPFAPAGTGAVGRSGGIPEDYELAGSTASGPDISVCIFERQAKHSQWIPVGGTADGIRVISFDSNHDRAVVMISGQRREISMRKATVASQGPTQAPRIDLSQSGSQPVVVAVNSLSMPASAPAAPVPTVAGSPEQEQREARMLVSDLLEIGVQQRKAYQDAKLKAAQATPSLPQN
jgi:hypothetical protein